MHVHDRVRMNHDTEALICCRMFLARRGRHLFMFFHDKIAIACN